MAEDNKTKIKNYETVRFDSCFPHQKEIRNCWQNYLDLPLCEKAIAEKLKEK